MPNKKFECLVRFINKQPSIFQVLDDPHADKTRIEATLCVNEGETLALRKISVGRLTPSQTKPTHFG